MEWQVGISVMHKKTWCMQHQVLVVSEKIYCASEIRTFTPALVLVVGADVLMYGILRI